MDELKNASGWTLLGPSDGRVNTFEISPDKKIYFIGTNSGGVFRSLDYGQTWEYYSKGLTINNIQYLKFISGTLYAVDYFQNTFQLGGDTWVESASKKDLVPPTLPITDQQGYIYYGPYGKVAPLRYSVDGGKTTQELSPSQEAFSSENSFWDIRQIYPLGNGVAILVNDNGVSEVNVLTKSVKKLAPVTNYSEITSTSASQSFGVISTTYWDHSSRISFDCGKNWERYYGSEWSHDFVHPYLSQPIHIEVTPTNPNAGDNSLIVSIIDFSKRMGIAPTFKLHTDSGENGINVSIGYAMAFDLSKSPTKAYIIYLDDQYKSWLASFSLASTVNLMNKSLGIPYANSIILDPSNPSRMIAASKSTVYESLNKGETWIKIFENPQIPEYLSNQAIAINPFDTQEVLFGGNKGDLIKLKNGSKTKLFFPNAVSRQNDSFYSSDTVALAYDDKKPNIIYVARLGNKEDRGFLFSTDGGITWKEFSKGLYSNDVRVIIPLEDKIFIGTWGSGNAVILKEKLFNSSVSQNPPIINEFRISQPITNTIRSTTLVWNASNAVSCILNGPNFANSSYSASEAISTGILTADSSYTLTCKNASGASVSKTLVVTVPPIQPVKPLSPKPNIQVAEPNVYRWLFTGEAQNIISWLGGGNGAVKVALVKSDYNPLSDDIIGWIYNGTPNSQTFWQQNTFPSSLIFWNGLQVTAPNGASIQTQNGFYKIPVISKNDNGNYCIISSTERCSYDLSDVQFTLVGR